MANVTNEYGKCVSFVDVERGGWMPITRRFCCLIVTRRQCLLTQFTKERCKQNGIVNKFVRAGKKRRKRIDKWPSHVFVETARTFKGEDQKLVCVKLCSMLDDSIWTANVLSFVLSCWLSSIIKQYVRNSDRLVQ